ncbi:MAG: response regulator [Candidatus Thorarchaeota archaeon]
MVVRVLHVDDDKAFLDVSRKILTTLDNDLQVISVADVSQALKVLETEEIDVIISDFQMNPTDGLEFLKMLRSSGNNIPFILLTGRGREEIVIDALNMGATNYLNKSGDAKTQYAELIHLVKTAAKHKQAEEALKESTLKTKRLLDQQIAINNLALKIGTTLDLDSVYKTIYDYVHELMDVYSFIVALYDEEEKMIRAGFVLAEGNLIDASKLPPIPLGEKDSGTQSRVIHTGNYFYSPDIRKPLSTSKTSYTVESDGTLKDGSPPEDDEESSKSSLYVPMKAGGKIVGVMQVQSQRLDAYCDNDIELLMALANVAALGIQNALLFKDLTESKR